MIVEIPVTADAAQSFVTQLGDVKFKFDLQWNDRSSQYSLTLTNDETEQVYVQGLPLVLGTDLLEPYSLGLGALLVVDMNNTHTEATLDSLGARVKLYWFSEDEVANV